MSLLDILLLCSTLNFIHFHQVGGYRHKDLPLTGTGCFKVLVGQSTYQLAQSYNHKLHITSEEKEVNDSLSMTVKIFIIIQHIKC